VEAEKNEKVTIREEVVEVEKEGEEETGNREVP